jgi:hypothetical protein
MWCVWRAILSVLPQFLRVKREDEGAVESILEMPRRFLERWLSQIVQNAAR